MGSKPSLSSTADDGAVGPENSEPTDLNMESSALLEIQQAEEVNQHTVTQQPTGKFAVWSTYYTRFVHMAFDSLVYTVKLSKCIYISQFVQVSELAR